MSPGDEGPSQSLPAIPATADALAPPAPEHEPPHPIALAVALLFHASRDVEECVAQYVPLAEVRHATAIQELDEQLKNLVSRAGAGDKSERGAVTRQLFDSVSRLERLALSEPGNTLRIALLLRLFSAYDIFIGSLLRALFDKKPDLLVNLGGEVKIAVILKSADLESFKLNIVSDYVESFRRTSYSDQFKTLERLADVSTLTTFPNWPSFVESAQRRNLLAHCGGIVNDQYLSNCRNAGATVLVNLKAGDTLGLDDAYILRTSRIVMEVSLKLAQTLWRKLLPDELAAADSNLHRVAYEGLQFQEWEWAEMVGDFACGLPRHSDEKSYLMAIVNRAIAIRQSGRRADAEGILDRIDWSAKAPEFKLAVAVLLEHYDEAAVLMRRIGKKGEIVDETSYHTWPLFREFRGSPQFAESYESVYGYGFVQDLEPEASRLEEALAGAGNCELGFTADLEASPPKLVLPLDSPAGDA